jgi:hypothetical protein
MTISVTILWTISNNLMENFWDISMDNCVDKFRKKTSRGFRDSLRAVSGTIARTIFGQF